MYASVYIFKIVQLPFFHATFLGETIIGEGNWCRGDYKELLPGRYLNGRRSEILCHDTERGLSLSYLLE